MALIKSTFKRWDGTGWNIHYFETSADVVQETDTFKVLTATERTKIATYLTNFGGANQLMLLDGSGLIPVAKIPGGLDYLPTNNPTFTGNLTGPNGLFNTLRINGPTPATKYYVFDYPAPDSLRIGTATGTALELTESDGINEGFIWNFGNGRLSALATPVNTTDAATKAYVDGLVAEGVTPIPSVKAATTSNLVSLSGTLVLDGYQTVIGDRVLVKNQTTVAQNGIYTVASGAWTKITAESTKGSLVFVENGNTQNDSKFYASTDTAWIKFSQVDTYDVIASGGLQKVGTNFGIESGGIGNSMIATGTIEWAGATNKLTTAASTDSIDVGNGWLDLRNATSNENLIDHIGQLYTAVKKIRGTANYNTNNAETIAGAYDLAEVKNRTYTGSTDPATTGYIAGDCYLQNIV